MVTLGDQNWYWASDVVCTHGQLLQGLFCFADKTGQIVLEGTSKEVVKLLADISTRPALEVKSGFVSFGKPKFIAIQMVPENLETLLRVEREHPGPQAFIHCLVIDNTKVLVEAYDAGAGEVLFSPLLPTTQLDDFVRLMEVELTRQEME